MKIRIKDNSIRLRLTKTDVSDLGKKGIVRCQTVLSPSQIFKYCLKTDSTIPQMHAEFLQNEITVILDQKSADTLTKTDEITVKGFQENGEKEQLFILVEKDLKCLDPTHEDQSDMYDNPSSVCG